MHKSPFDRFPIAAAAFLALSLPLATGAAEPALGRPVELAVESFELDNGMRFLLVRRPGQPMTAAGWAVRSGSAADPAGATGLAHLVEHALFHGTRTLGRGEYARIYAAAGGAEVHAATERDFTVFDVMLPAEKLELWFWMESDRLLAPVFGDVERERAVIAEERRTRLESTPTGALVRELETRLWGPLHPYAPPVIGRPEDLPRLARRRAEQFFDAHYVPANLVAALVGEFEPARVRSLAAKYFGRLPASPPPPQPRFAVPAPAGSRLAAGCECRPQVLIIYRTVPFGHPDGATLDVLAGILNGRHGRLHRSLVLEGGLAFAAFAEQASLAGGGSFTVRLEAREEAGLEAVEKAWYAELATLERDPVAADELTRAKRQILADAVRRLEEPRALMMRLLIYEAMAGARDEARAGAIGEATAGAIGGTKDENRGGWEHLNRWPAAAARVSAADVTRVTRRYFAPEGRIVGVLAPGAERAPRGE